MTNNRNTPSNGMVPNSHQYAVQLRGTLLLLPRSSTIHRNFNKKVKRHQAELRAVQARQSTGDTETGSISTALCTFQYPGPSRPPKPPTTFLGQSERYCFS